MPIVAPHVLETQGGYNQKYYTLNLSLNTMRLPLCDFKVFWGKFSVSVYFVLKHIAIRRKLPKINMYSVLANISGDLW